MPCAFQGIRRSPGGGCLACVGLSSAYCGRALTGQSCPVRWRGRSRRVRRVARDCSRPRAAASGLYLSLTSPPRAAWPRVRLCAAGPSLGPRHRVHGRRVEPTIRNFHRIHLGKLWPFWYKVLPNGGRSVIAGLDARTRRRATRCYGVGRLGEAAQQADCRCTSRVNRRRRNPVWARAQARRGGGGGLFRDRARTE